jgi:serine/threonine-protein kinase RsbW
MRDSDHLHLQLPAVPDSIGRARDAVADRARALGLDRRAVDDLRTIVSEACTNVVLHAYPDGPGERPLEVELRSREDGLELCVRDHGVGIGAVPGSRVGGLRMGLLIVGALASCFQLRSVRDQGTEFRIRFPFAPAP